MLLPDFLRLSSFEHKDSWTQIFCRPTYTTPSISRVCRGEALRIGRPSGSRTFSLPLEQYLVYNAAPWDTKLDARFLDSNSAPTVIDSYLAIQINVAGFLLPSRGGFAWTLKWGDTYKHRSSGGSGYYDETTLTNLALGFALEAVKDLLESTCRFATFPLIISSSCSYLSKVLLKIKNVTQTIGTIQDLLRCMQGPGQNCCSKPL